MAHKCVDLTAARSELYEHECTFEKLLIRNSIAHQTCKFNDCHQHSVSLTCSYARPCTFDLQSFVLHILQAQEGRVDSPGWRLTNSEHSYRSQWLDIVSLSPDIASFELVGHFHHEERNAAFVSSYE